MSEAGLPGPGKKIDTARKLGTAVGDVAGAGWDWTTSQLKKLDPRQIYNKNIKTTYSSADKDPGGVLDVHRKNIEANAKLEPRIAQQQATIDKMAGQTDRLTSLRDKQVLRGKPVDKTDAAIAKRQEVGSTAATRRDELTGQLKDPTPPAPTSRSAGGLILPVGGLEYVAQKATASDEHPYGEYSLGRGVHAAAQGYKDFVGNTVTGGPDGASTSARQVDDTPPMPNRVTTKESLSDILKLAGAKAITERDNVSGMTKVKEIKQLNESTELNECGMGMPSSGNTTASLSINATAGSGEEVANMLKSLMDLAGVKPVTGDMLGGETMPMPMIKAIDIISKPHDHNHDHDSMEPQEDELNKQPLTGSMEEEYANTPADPKDVPKFDNDKYSYQPNQPQQGNRMDGNMPKGNPKVSEGNLAEALLKEYEAFKNGQ